MTIPSTVSDVIASQPVRRVDRTDYLQHLLSLRSALDGSASKFEAIREQAASLVRDRAIPSTRDEDWRFTDLSSLLQTQFQVANASAPTLRFDDIQTFLRPEALSSRLVFVDGHYDPALSSVDDLPDGVVVTSLAMGAELFGDLPQYLAQQQGANETFTLLNTASFRDGALIWVQKNQAIVAPIQILYIATATQPTVISPRVLVVAEANSQLTLVEEYVTLYAGTALTNAVTEFWLDTNAKVNHTRIQQDSGEAFHIGKTAVSQARDSRYICNAISCGAKLSRHNLEVYQTGEQTETTLNGLTTIGDEQLADTHSLISYTKPHGTSHQIHKCIVDDRAHAVFNGKILVPKLAQLTDAGQLSSTLLLSEKARVDTKPQLEITADNVKCAHGATVSQLDNDEVFYLQSRGIDAESARRLLTYAFAYDVLKEIPVPSLRDTLAQYVRKHF